MGNCAGYCISENPDENKKKVTVEEKFNNPFKTLNELTEQSKNDNFNEFEIDYA